MPKLQCTVTGLWYSVTTNHLRELVDKYGDESTLRNTYVSRDARRLRKQDHTDDEIRTMVENGDITSKTTAPKRESTLQAQSAVAQTDTPAPVAVTETTETATEDDAMVTTDEIDDPDINAFMNGDLGGDIEAAM